MCILFDSVKNAGCQSHLPNCGTYNFRSMHCIFVSVFENPGSATVLLLAAHSSPQRVNSLTTKIISVWYENVFEELGA